MVGKNPPYLVLPPEEVSLAQVRDFVYEQCPEVGKCLDDILKEGWQDAIYVSIRSMTSHRERKYQYMKASGKLTPTWEYFEMVKQWFLLQVFKKIYGEFAIKEGNWAELMIAHITPKEFLRELYHYEKGFGSELGRLVYVPDEEEGWPTSYLFKYFYKDCEEIRSQIGQIQNTPKIKKLLNESCERRRYRNRDENDAGGKYITRIAYRFRIYTWILNAAYTEVCIHDKFYGDPRNLMLKWITAERFERAIIAVETQAEIEDTWIMTSADRGYM